MDIFSSISIELYNYFFNFLFFSLENKCVYITQSVLSSGTAYDDFNLVIISENITGIVNKKPKLEKDLVPTAVESTDSASESTTSDWWVESEAAN